MFSCLSNSFKWQGNMPHHMQVSLTQAALPGKMQSLCASSTRFKNCSDLYCKPH